MQVFLRQTHEHTVYEREKKLIKPNTQNKINSIRNPFILKKKKKEIKYRIIRDIWTLFLTKREEIKKEIRKKELMIDWLKILKIFNQEGEKRRNKKEKNININLKELVISGIIIILNMKVMVI